MKLMELLKQPWPWWVGGIIIGLTVPALLILGNKHFGISANLRHACAACFPSNIKFFKYDWKKEVWNIFFVGGILIGAFLATRFLTTTEPVKVAPALLAEFKIIAARNFQCSKFIYASRIYYACSRRFFCWLWYPLCGRLHKRTFDHGYQ
jgi:uncharacterized membrane protein YedE/YeeE